jgi:membrane protease YdiL (CAAX protease family)
MGQEFIDLTVAEQAGPPPRPRRMDTFRRVEWSWAQCAIACGILVAFRITFVVLGRWHAPRRVLFWVNILLWLAMFVFMAALPLWSAGRKGWLRRPRGRRILKELGLAIPLVICLVIVEILMATVLTAVFGVPAEQLGSPLAPLREAPNDPRLYLFLLPMFTLGPLAEELFFRGFLYNVLRRGLPALAAVGMQALFFALIHYQPPQTTIAYIGVVFVLGLVLAGVYEWRKTLWAPIAVHSLQNLLFAGPVLLLMVLNSHAPARTWEEAGNPPAWLSTSFLPIERQADGEAQRLYAIDMWGTRGLHLWKQEIRALEAVGAWFPQDRRACADARAGIAWVFRTYLRDPRRSIVQCNGVLSEFPDQPESCAGALLTRAEAYRDLGDDPKSQAAYEEVVHVYSSVDWARAAAEQGLKDLENP